VTVSIDYSNLSKTIKTVFLEICYFVFLDPSEGSLFLELEHSYLGSLFLELEHSYSLATNLQRINSQIIGRGGETKKNSVT
jgi:hypothetical protein